MDFIPFVYEVKELNALSLSEIQGFMGSRLFGFVENRE
jgi:hypothetical protein